MKLASLKSGRDGVLIVVDRDLKRCARAPVSTLQAALDSVPPHTDLLVCHQVWHEFMGDKAAPQGSLSDVQNVKVVFTGDFHERVELDVTNRDGGKTHVISPGSMALQSIDEAPKKYFAVLRDDLTVRWVMLHSRVVMPQQVISTLQDLEDFLDAYPGHLNLVADVAAERHLPPELCTPVQRIVYPSHMRGDKIQARISKVAAGRVHLFWKELPADKPAVTARREQARVAGVRRATTLDSALLDYLKQDGREDLGKDCRRLLDSLDLPGELVKMRAEAVAAAHST